MLLECNDEFIAENRLLHSFCTLSKHHNAKHVSRWDFFYPKNEVLLHGSPLQHFFFCCFLRSFPLFIFLKGKKLLKQIKKWTKKHKKNSFFDGPSLQINEYYEGCLSSLVSRMYKTARWASWAIHLWYANMKMVLHLKEDSVSSSLLLSGKKYRAKGNICCKKNSSWVVLVILFTCRR